MRPKQWWANSRPNQQWSDLKKWATELGSRCIVAVLIAALGAAAAYFIDLRIQESLLRRERSWNESSAEKEETLRKDLAKRDRQFRAELTNYERELAAYTSNRQTIRDVARQWLTTLIEYTDAQEAAFDDVYYRHSQYNEENKGANQRAYENTHFPHFQALRIVVGEYLKNNPDLDAIDAGNKDAHALYEQAESGVRGSSIPDKREEATKRLLKHGARVYVDLIELSQRGSPGQFSSQ